MPSRASIGRKHPRDANQLAYQIVQESVGNVEPEPPDTRNPAAVALSKARGVEGWEGAGQGTVQGPSSGNSKRGG